MKATVSIIIPVHNRIDVTKKGLGFIVQAANYYSNSSSCNAIIRIIVVDDGSKDGTGAWIEKNHPQVKVLYGDGNLWWTGAVNKAIKFSIDHLENLEGIILQNDDVILEKTWVLDLLESASSNPGSLIGCATAIYEHKDLIHYGGRELNSWFARERKINYGAKRSQFKKGFVSSSFDLYGRGMYIPLEVIEKIGMFDTKKFKHRGDMDIPLRAKKAGFKLLVSYDAIVYELPQLTFGLDVKPKITLTDAYKLLSDFRSSHNLNFIYQYSRIATTNPWQFYIFFLGNIFYNVRGVSWRLLRNYL